MLFALVSVPTEEDRDHARVQGNPLCWQERWLFFFRWAKKEKKKHKVMVKIFWRRGLMLVAQGSVPTEEDQDQARDQGIPQCWQGRWQG